LTDYGLRLSRGLKRNLNEKKTALSAARLPKLQSVVSAPRQRLDIAAAKLPRPDRLFAPASQRLSALRLRPDSIRIAIESKGRILQQEARTANSAIQNSLEKSHARLSRAAQLLEAYSYQGVLERGYALVQKKSGDVVRSKTDVEVGDGVTLTFADGSRDAVIEGEEIKLELKKATKSPVKKTAKKATANNQQDLF